MNNLQIFNNKQFGQVRMVEIDGKPFFVAKDIALCLGYKDTTNAVKQHCRWVVKHHLGVVTGKKKDGTDAIQTVEMNVIPEGDMYRLITNSELPLAAKFESWIFDEVLPTIRKTGTYQIKKEKTEREKALAIIAELPNDRYKNRTVVKILNFIDNNGQERRLISKPTLTDEEVKSILEDFISTGDGILKETINGLALEKEKLYKCFAQYGLNKTDVLRAIDKIGLIPKSFASRTPNVKFNGDVIRAIVIKEN